MDIASLEGPRLGKYCELCHNDIIRATVHARNPRRGSSALIYFVNNQPFSANEMQIAL